MEMKSRGILTRISVIVVALLAAAPFGAAALEIQEQVINPSTGKVVPGEWNRNFDEAKALADSEHIPMIVFYGGMSCGVCELLQRALEADDVKAKLSERKMIMVFTTDNTRGNASAFATPKPTSKQQANPDAPVDQYGEFNWGFPYIAIYWNRDGVVPEKFSADYRCFRGKDGYMLAKGGSLADQFMRSVDCVAGGYPYSGGEFVLPDTESTRLEVEEGYSAGCAVRIPLQRKVTVESTNRLVFNGATTEIVWAAGETRKLVEVPLPGGLTAGTMLPMQLLASDGSVHATSSVAIVALQPNSLRNPRWIGEDFAAGEWTMDLDTALAQAKSAAYGSVLVLHTGALWCPHCQGLERDVFGTEDFKSWAIANKVALVELDNPHRTSSSQAEDLACRMVTGTPPTLLRYDAGSNSFLSRQESGASYLTRKGIAVGDAVTPGTAEYVLQRNRNLGYEWGEGTYCAPDAGRCGYPTVVLLNADGSIAGRLNRLEGDSCAYDLAENMYRLNALLRLSGGSGETANYPKTTSRTLSPGAGAATVDFQINDRVEYFSLRDLPSGRVSFAANGAPVGNPVTLSVIRYENGVQTVVASSQGSVSCAVAAEPNLFLKVEAYAESRAYGDDPGFSATISSSLILVPAERTSVLDVGGRALQLEVAAGVKYRLEGFENLDAGIFRDDGEAEDGGRYYTALANATCPVSAAGSSVAYQVWRPGVIAITPGDITLFKASGSCTFSVVRLDGSSGPASVKVKVVGGDAERGVRYDWDDSTTVSWADGECGAVDLTFRLLDYGEFMPNQTVVLGLADAAGSGSSGVSGDCLSIMICDTDKPTLPKTEYAIPAYATFDAASAIAPQKAYNVDGGKVTIKKVNGKLPSGVKLVYEDGSVKLSGSPTKTGTYSYTFTLQQKQGRETKVGPEITMAFDVASPSDVAAGGNVLLNKAVSATLPLYEEVDGARQLAGIIEYTITKKNVIKAKCQFLEKKSVTFKGRWATMTGGAVETDALFAKDGRWLRLSMNPDGAMTAVLANPVKGTVYSTFGTLRAGEGSFAAPYAGYYTVALREKASDDPMGDGYILIKAIGANGKAKWSGVLANGQSVSGTSTITRDDAGNAVLPILKYKSGDWIALSLKVRPNGSSLAFPRAVLLCDGTVGRWSHHVAPASLHYVEARGCWYDKKNALDQCCALQFFGTELLLTAATEGYRSEAYGDAPPSPAVDVIVLPDNLKLEGGQGDVKMKFLMKTGVFSGSMKLAFSGKKVTAKYKGVVIPGWHDCFCELPDPSDPYRIDVSQPFAVGAVWFSDKVGGKSVKRGFLVKIDERVK